MDRDIVDRVLARIAAGSSDELLAMLDAAARDVCGYDYGLPIHDDAQRAKMREIVERWVRESGGA